MSQDDQEQRKGKSTLTQVQPDEEVALVDTAPVLGDITSENVKQNSELFKGIGGNSENVETEDFLTITSNFIDRNLQSIKVSRILVVELLLTSTTSSYHNIASCYKLAAMFSTPLDYQYVTRY